MAFVTARLNAAVDEALATTTHLQLHTGPPGGSGTGNVAAGVDREPVTWSSASSGSSQGTVTFTIPGAGGPFTHVSLWTAESNGTFNGDGELDPDEEFAGAGTLEVTVTVTAT